MHMEKTLKPLSECSFGDCFLIKEINIKGPLRRRLLDLGFVKEAEISVLRKSPLGDPVAYRVSNTTIALRNNESSMILGEIVRGNTK
ncbi:MULTISPECIES: FeoA family protein [unclassified Lysinibacillus]|uniref:Ferrous iron transport protein A n=2 Tax=Lysinibacillus TaxID=400634 RepID=A0A544UDU5_LYSSH|nr:ferrous iron transport protein A [Lysinibacillus sp. SDF0037]